MKKYLSENDFFESSDLSLVSTLYYFGVSIEAVDKTDPSRAKFVFTRNKELDALIEGFWSKSLQIEPQGYFNSLREIKTRLYKF